MFAPKAKVQQAGLGCRVTRVNSIRQRIGGRITVVRCIQASKKTASKNAESPTLASARNPIFLPEPHEIQTSHTAKELAARYGFPVITQRSRFWIAVLELGGGFLESDLSSYCTQQRIDLPEIASITLPGGDGEFKGGNSADIEYALDVQNVAGATHGLVNILVVNAPNNLAAFADGLKVVADWKPPGNGKVSAVSLSWGADEHVWEDAQEAIKSTESALEALGGMNIPVFVASGDNGAKDGQLTDSVLYPASSPNAFGCGGTSIDGNLETAWFGSGGGLSKLFPRPSYQIFHNVEEVSKGHRCVPDAAGNADPRSGYSVILDGKQTLVGGTSAVAPMYAAWKALTDTRADDVLPFSAATVYELHDLTDIVLGNNGDYNAGPGFDLCTGEGILNGNFTEAWLVKNQHANKFAQRYTPRPLLPGAKGQ